LDKAPNMCATFVLAQIIECDENMARGELRKAYEHLQAENKNRNMSYLGTPDEGLYHFDVLRQALKNHHKHVAIKRRVYKLPCDSQLKWCRSHSKRTMAWFACDRNADGHACCTASNRGLSAAISRRDRTTGCARGCRSGRSSPAVGPNTSSITSTTSGLYGVPRGGTPAIARRRRSQTTRFPAKFLECSFPESCCDQHYNSIWWMTRTYSEGGVRE
jgi:hypothetical protein